MRSDVFPAAVVAVALLAGACSGPAPDAGDRMPEGFRGLTGDERLRLADADAGTGWRLHVPTAVPEDTRLAVLEPQDLGRAGTGVALRWDVRREGYELEVSMLQISPDAERPDTSRPPPARSPEGADALVADQTTVTWAVGEVTLATVSEEDGRGPRQAQASWAEEGRHFTSVVLAHRARADTDDGDAAVPAVEVDDLRVVVESLAPLD